MPQIKKKGNIKKRGRPYTGGRDPIVSLRMPLEVRKETEALAEEEGLTLSKAILKVLEEGLAKRRSKKAARIKPSPKSG
jgi:hypothetical protein